MTLGPKYHVSKPDGTKFHSLLRCNEEIGMQFRKIEIYTMFNQYVVISCAQTLASLAQNLLLGQDPGANGLANGTYLSEQIQLCPF